MNNLYIARMGEPMIWECINHLKKQYAITIDAQNNVDCMIPNALIIVKNRIMTPTTSDVLCCMDINKKYDMPKIPYKILNYREHLTHTNDMQDPEIQNIIDNTPPELLKTALAYHNIMQRSYDSKNDGKNNYASIIMRLLYNRTGNKNKVEHSTCLQAAEDFCNGIDHALHVMTIKSDYERNIRKSTSRIEISSWL